MIAMFRRKAEPTTAPQADAPSLAPETGVKVADAVGTLISGIGCLSANVAAAVQEVHRALAAGAISEGMAADLIAQVQDAHDDVERACRLVSRARVILAPPPTVDHNADGHHG